MNIVEWARNSDKDKNKHLLTDMFKTRIIDLIQSVLTYEEYKYLLQKTNSNHALSNLLKRVCNMRCVQKRKPFVIK